MALTGSRTYVGFGFGAIQANLFLYEAFQSGNFGRLVVAEVLPQVVAAVRQAGGYYRTNIARQDGLERATVGPIEIEDPTQTTDRERLIAAIAAAEEIGTAIPSVNFYAAAGPGSLHQVLAAGLRRKAATDGPRAVIYAAENHNHAAELLDEQVFAAIPAADRAAVGTKVRFLNTVIAKMGGVKTNPAEIEAQGLVTATPDDQRAFLVESFNRILISQITFPETADQPPFQRGLDVFAEKGNLFPFEEAKLYGHNAMHALMAYLGAVRGVELIADLRRLPGLLDFVLAASLQEAGAALIRKHGGVDPLFTPAGFRAAQEDLLARMTNPYLRDSVTRVGRDPGRKLGWDDRLIGTMRLAQRYRIDPVRHAFGAAAALASLDPTLLDSPAAAIQATLRDLWSPAKPDPAEQSAMLDLVEAGRQRLRRWLAAPDTDPAGLFAD